MLYAYEQSSSFVPLINETHPNPAPDSPARTVCILGVPHANTLFPILSSTIVNRIIIIYDPTIFSFNAQGYNFTEHVFSDDFALLAHIFGKSMVFFENISLVEPQCQIVQIEPSVIVEPTKLKDIILSRLVDRDFAAHSFVRILWIDYYRNIPKNPEKTQFERISYQNYSRLFPWQLSSTWTTHSKFFLVTDSNGFTQKTYQFNQDNLESLACVSIYLYSIPSENEKKKLVAQSAPRDFVIVVTTVNRVLIDNVLGLQSALKALGFRFVQVVYDLTVSAYEVLLRKTNFHEERIIQIFIGPSDIALFHRQYIAFNTEQKWQDMIFGRASSRFHAILNSSISIWNFYQPLTEYLAEIPSYSKKTFTIPLYTYERNLSFYQANLPAIRKSIISPFQQDLLSNLEGETQSLDTVESSVSIPEVLFFGSNSDRRTSVLLFLSGEFEKYVNRHEVDGLIASNPKYRRFLFRLFAGPWNRLIFDYERDFYTTHSTLVLNVNNFDESALETHRLNYLLSMGKCVVSERGSDYFLTLFYENAVVFVNSKEELAQKTIELIENEDLRKDCERRALQRFQLLNGNRVALHETMKKILSWRNTFSA